jgi:hypothetical protein
VRAPRAASEGGGGLAASGESSCAAATGAIGQLSSQRSCQRSLRWFGARGGGHGGARRCRIQGRWRGAAASKEATSGNAAHSLAVRQEDGRGLASSRYRGAARQCVAAGCERRHWPACARRLVVSWHSAHGWREPVHSPRAVRGHACTRQLVAPVPNPDPPNRFVQAAILDGQPLLHPDTVAFAFNTGIVEPIVAVIPTVRAKTLCVAPWLVS